MAGLESRLNDIAKEKEALQNALDDERKRHVQTKINLKKFKKQSERVTRQRDKLREDQQNGAGIEENKKLQNALHSERKKVTQIKGILKQRTKQCKRVTRQRDNLRNENAALEAENKKLLTRIRNARAKAKRFKDKFGRIQTN